MPDKLPPCANEFTFIGVENSVCPSCGVVLDHFPERKTKCRDCGEFTYSRGRPIDGKKVLLKADQLEQLELEWSLDYRIKWTEMPRERLEQIEASVIRQIAERIRRT